MCPLYDGNVKTSLLLDCSRSPKAAVASGTIQKEGLHVVIQREAYAG
jgi:hypothetical protein